MRVKGVAREKATRFHKQAGRHLSGVPGSPLLSDSRSGRRRAARHSFSPNMALRLAFSPG